MKGRVTKSKYWIYKVEKNTVVEYIRELSDFNSILQKNGDKKYNR